jgi:hypothetical protein
MISILSENSDTLPFTMQNVLSGLLGFFMGFGSLFHGGQGLPVHQTPSQTNQQAPISGTPASSSGMMREKEIHIPAGDKGFFGTVTAINGSKLTLQTQRGMRGRPNSTNTLSGTPPPATTVTITLDETTAYTGGAQADIAINTKLAGYGKPNSDESINAIKIQINPQIPSGFPMRNRRPDTQNKQEK